MLVASTPGASGEGATGNSTNASITYGLKEKALGTVADTNLGQLECASWLWGQDTTPRSRQASCKQGEWQGSANKPSYQKGAFSKCLVAGNSFATQPALILTCTLLYINIT